MMAKRRLLLADDSITIQKVVNLTFADEGVEVTAVSDGDSAMKKFVELMPDLVMADVNMPGLDGYRICETIKQNAETKHIPVILLVGSFEPFDENEARRVGADDFLTKPFQSIRQLVNKVSDLLEAKNGEEDFFLPIENAPTVGGGDEPDSASRIDDEEIVSRGNFGDAEMDDEMIQTAQFAEAEIEPAVEYESEPISESDLSYETAVEETETPASQSSPDFAEKSSTGTHAAGNQTKTPSLMEKDYAEMTTDDSAAVKTTSTVSFDDFDLLEFPKLTQKAVADQIVLHTGAEIPIKPGNDAAAATTIPKQSIEIADDMRESKDLSPETIEAIADRIVEKISSRFVERIAREVVRQMKEKN